jgi:hypothetical protein
MGKYGCHYPLPITCYQRTHINITLFLIKAQSVLACNCFPQGLNLFHHFIRKLVQFRKDATVLGWRLSWSRYLLPKSNLPPDIDAHLKADRSPL